jgi:hypothetical protein
MTGIMTAANCRASWSIAKSNFACSTVPPNPRLANPCACANRVAN